ncbi:hypothetical protein HPP92_003233 [Vanilla planifolia]|uniref:DYW domain-containing protein n=1 Tax=Vanilla planifolia TaxID=51239 RepID=A0A835SBE3_VANPL|nr:hypothetical protein HPP92_003233 [Vanilla planifolia]
MNATSLISVSLPPAFSPEAAEQAAPCLSSPSLLTLLPKCSSLREFKQFHALSVKSRLHRDPLVVSKLIDALVDNSSPSFLAFAHQLFDEIPHRDVVVFNTLVRGYSRSHDPHRAISLFCQMLEASITPTRTPFRPCSRLAHPPAPSRREDRPMPVPSSSALGTMPSSFPRSSTSCVQSSRPTEALALFRELQTRNIRPTYVTILGVLAACALIGALDLGRWIHEYVKKTTFASHIKVHTALIDMYAKCGSLEDAVCVFEEMRFRDTQAWSAMIMAYAIHGQGIVALSQFDEMLRKSVRPDEITFLGVLYSCSHAGMVDEGLRYFGTMQSDYDIHPGIKHYGCVVDLLARAGKLEEAYNFINGKVGGCESNTPSDEQERVVKVPGCSSIEVDGTVHEFFAGDGKHPDSMQVHRMVDMVVEQLKAIGYAPDMSKVHHMHLTEQQKEASLRYHGEKLAIAFGLINTSPGTTIRVVKNLRVCRDCHSYAKLVSLLFGRKIILRDLNRFHHFGGGKCSCADYW